MFRLLKLRVRLDFLINPFYLFCIAFALAITLYLWRWSSIFPPLSFGLILFLILSFLLFISAGLKFANRVSINSMQSLNLIFFKTYLSDYIFYLIIGLGMVNVLGMGYLPVLERTNDYREFGIPVLDPIFNSLSIFFSVFYLQLFLGSKKKKFLIFTFIILLFQILIFRRSTLVWILASSIFLFILYRQRIKIILILVVVLCLPILSYSFGLYGNNRSNLSKNYVLNDLGASSTFIGTGLSHNHYMTYLYVSSPLANLQKNIDEGEKFINNGDFKDFFFYCLLPASITMRLEQRFNLEPPLCSLITPDLIVGTIFMVSFYTLGWLGMSLMTLFLLGFIILSMLLVQRFDLFKLTSISILSTAVALSIFTNFLNRLDVVIMLFIYPVIFHFIYEKRTVHKTSIAR